MPSPGTKWPDRRPSCARPGGISALRSTSSARVGSWNAGGPWSDCLPTTASPIGGLPLPSSKRGTPLTRPARFVCRRLASLRRRQCATTPARRSSRVAQSARSCAISALASTATSSTGPVRRRWRPRWRSYSGAGSASARTSVTLAVSCLRSVGLAARYVSGYLETKPPRGRPKLLGADASHAWASVLVPQAGWVDVDPTNDQFVDDRYVVLAHGRDYDDVPPLEGVILSDASHSTMRVRVDVTRV
jgi:Transglutaminase-like superfamily